MRPTLTDEIMKLNADRNGLIGYLAGGPLELPHCSAQTLCDLRQLGRPEGDQRKNNHQQLTRTPPKDIDWAVLSG